MTSKLTVLLKKYSIPFLLFVAGIIMLSVGIRKNQDSMFMISSVMMFAAGGISILYSSGKFKPTYSSGAYLENTGTFLCMPITVMTEVYNLMFSELNSLSEKVVAPITNSRIFKK